MSKITEIEQYIGCTLPKTYRNFLLSHKKEMNRDVYLYLPENIIERNDCYETKQYAPGCINIGDNGGGMAFVINLGEDDPEVSAVGHGSMDPELKETVGPSFSSWLASGFEYHDE
jgi:hypothetical protein